jgi:cell division protein FtsB
MKSIIVALVLLLIILQYELWFAKGGLFSARNLNHSVALQQTVNAKLKKRNAALSADIKDLRSGKKSVEERARNDLGMIKKGETFYQVIKH